MPKTKRSRNDSDYIVLRVPRWVTKAYIMMAIILLPWTIYLGVSLPQHHLSAHWDVSWTGLDAGLIVTLLGTGVFAYMRSVWVVITSSTTGGLLLVDAWFDVMSERRESDFRQALVLAICIELPLAMLSYYLASHVLYHNATNTKRRT